MPSDPLPPFSQREIELDEPITVTLKRREWTVIVAAARSYDVRVPMEQGDGGASLDVIEKAINLA